MDNAIFFFDAQRDWVFPPTPTPAQPSRSAQLFNTTYVNCDEDLRELIKAKEERGLCFWFRPRRDWSLASAFFERISDPETGKKLHPLQLRAAHWLSMAGSNGWQGEAHRDGRKRDPDCVPRFTKSVAKVASVLRSGSFDYAAVMELIYQSNRNLQPRCALCPPIKVARKTWSQVHGLG